MRKVWVVEVFEDGEWKIKGLSTSYFISEQSWRNISKGRRTRLNEYTYDDLDFLWTHARDCVTLEKSDEAGTIS